MDIARERHNLDFDVAKSVRYHAYCRAFWELLDRRTKVLVVFSGAAVFISFLADAPHWLTQSFAALVAFLSICDVVFGFSANAKRHDELYRRFARLGMEIAVAEVITEGDVRRWRSQRLDIEMEEPTVKDWLERRCSAEEAKSRGLEVDPAWKIGSFKWKMAPLLFWPNW